MGRILLAILGLFIFFNDVFGQIDKTFWFAAPEVTATHADRPILLRMSTIRFEAEVTISIPANPQFSPIEVVIPLNDSKTIDLTPWIDDIENGATGVVTQKGLLIESTTEITAYYEVKGADNNSDLFTLKGKNALGTDFYTPFQNELNNHSSVNGYASFDIVATENNTTIVITPSKDVVGHDANDDFMIVLQRGETYSVRALTKEGAEHPAGSHILSDKPIAVTIKDDSVFEGGWDLIGDQLVPIVVLGDEHVIGEGWGYVLAVENNTKIQLNGTDWVTLNKGEQAVYFAGENNPTYFKSDKVVYVLNVTIIGRGQGAFSGELAGALIPPLNCTGSDRTTFTRSAYELFYAMIVVKSGAETAFKLNGDENVITQDLFQTVPGTNGEWLFAKVDLFDTTIVPIDEASVITNSINVFHVGILSGTPITGSKYGYFSNFASLDLGIDFTACDHETTILSAGIGRDSYLWSTGDTTPTIRVDTTGLYWAVITEGTCIEKDTVEITVIPGVELDLGVDFEICKGDDSVLTAGPEVDSLTYVWSTGETTASISINVESEYLVAVTRTNGCTNKDTIYVGVLPLPILNGIPGDTVFCFGDSLVIDLDTLLGEALDDFDFIWSDNDSSRIRMFDESAVLKLTIENICGIDSKDLNLIENQELELNLGPDFILCEGLDTTVVAPSGWQAYLWGNDSTFQEYQIKEAGTYWLKVIDSVGCSVSDTFVVSGLGYPTSDFPSDTSICGDDILVLNLDSTYDIYDWNIGDDVFRNKFSEEGFYTLTVSNFCGTASDSMTLHHWDIEVPNIFTPNGDLKNETLRVSGLEDGQWELEVYSRWGDRVYFHSNYDNSWQAEDITDGVYYYQLKEGQSRHCNTYKGWVMITR